ncbi:tetratricopeptide repeat protein [Brachyspira hyodysenteriae]|nr:tetratricopeptide repeat protein [Brachyspira hyodysenteriae]MDA0029088.1 tetratricopeptide repeat protein [Brachyspira hyodysenteriae]
MLKKAIEKDPNNIDAYITLGDLYEKLDNIDDRNIIYNKAIEIYSNENDAYSFENIGNLYEKLGDIEQRNKAYKKSNRNI